MKVLIYLFLVVLALVFTQSVSAHVRGMSIFKINGENTMIAPIEYKHPSIPLIPEDSDLAPQKYSPDQPLIFELDLSKLITSPEIFEKTTFIWDFGDGSPKQTIVNGSTNNHTYSEDGTYLLTIYADYTTAGFADSIPEPQILQAVIIEIESEKGTISNVFFPTALILLPVFAVLALMGRRIWYRKKKAKV